EEAAQPAGGRFFQQAGTQHRLYCSRSLPQTTHAAHALEERRGEAGVAKKVVVQKVKVAPWQTLNFGQRVVYHLGVEPFAAGEERLFVAEITAVRAAAGDDDGVGHQVEVAFDQITTYGRQLLQGALLGTVKGLWLTTAKIGQELGPGVFAGAQENGVGMLCCFLWQ